MSQVALELWSDPVLGKRRLRQLLGHDRIRIDSNER